MGTRRMPAEQRRESILKAAERCVARRGYYSATTADIAAEAGVTEPVLYQHFHNKDDLMEQMRERTSEQIRDYLARRVLKQPTPLKMLREIAEGALDYTSRHRAKLRAWSYSIPNLESGGLRTTGKRDLDRFHNIICYLLEEARRQGEVGKDFDIPDFAWSFLSMVQLIYLANSLGIDILFKSKDKYMDLIDRLLRTVSAPGDEGGKNGGQ